MAHIQVPEGVPGIRSLVMFRPETGQHLYQLAQVLLRGPSTLSEADRELIAAYVSNQNNCHFCMSSHAAAARCLFGDQSAVVDQTLKDIESAGLSPKMKSLLHIAGKVQILGSEVKQADVNAARIEGATDREIHDTVLIVATFCMFNRYVDGLGTWAPEETSFYVNRAPMRARDGYTASIIPAAV